MKLKAPVACFMAVVWVAALWGCVRTGRPMAKPQNIGTAVFTEVRDDQQAPKGSVDLIVRASFKTPLHKHYLLESRTPPSEEGTYPFELNVDGQEVIWKAKGNIENTPVSGPEGRLPEGGVGDRHVLEKKIRLMPGLHHVVFGLPYENYYTEVKVALKEGETHTLEFKPVYAPNRRGYETFERGIRNYQVYFDGARIR